MNKPKEITIDRFNYVPFWAKLFPYRYKLLKIRNELKNRSPWDVLLQWNEQDVDINLVASASKIIASIANYPNALLLPYDNIEVLCADYDGSLTDIHIWNEFQNQIIKKNVEYNGQLNDKSYVDFIKLYLSN
jgi:hypothetical protein